MVRIRHVTLSLLAVCALSAAVAGPAQAAIEGPFYKVGGVRLRAFASKNIIEVKAGAAGFTLKTGAPVVEIHCAKLKAITNPTTLVPSMIIGSNGANGSGSKETLGKFEECTAPAPCKVAGGIIETKALINRLAYAEKPPKRGTKILVVFEPENGSNFSTIKFTGTGCTLTEIAVEPEVAGGGACGEAWSGGAAVEAEKREPEVKVGEVNFPATAIAKAWVEDAGVLTEVKCGLVITGARKATLEGLSSFELEAKPNWGVFT